LPPTTGDDGDSDSGDNYNMNYKKCKGKFVAVLNQVPHHKTVSIFLD